MNSVFLSPHFPSNFYHFAVHLRAAGATVLGVADEPYDALHPDLKNNLTEYFRVSDMHNYDELVRALGFFTYKYGKIDHIDSHNEYWLETEAKLRTDFNISGIKLDEVGRIKRKSEMKRVFQKAGLKVARGCVCRTFEELMFFIREVGYPVVAKPDIGVGAAQTFKLSSEADSRLYWEQKPPIDYIVEEYIDGRITTYDGLLDSQGNVMFASTMTYNKGVMDIVNQDTDMYYTLTADIDPEIEKAGVTTLRAFNVHSRFFHFEYFITSSDEVYALEVNMRPPGGLTLDMFNYVFDFDCYKLWAEMIVNGRTGRVPDPQRCCIYISRKDQINYSMSHWEVLERYKGKLVHHERMSPIVSRVMGNDGYILRDKQLDTLIQAADNIQQRGMQ